MAIPNIDNAGMSAVNESFRRRGMEIPTSLLDQVSTGAPMQQQMPTPPPMPMPQMGGMPTPPADASMGAPMDKEAMIIKALSNTLSNYTKKIPQVAPIA